jgi:hypothetical protein
LYGGSDLTNVIIGTNVTSIGINAFLGCSMLTSVSIPSSVASIGDGAFMDCTALTGISIPDGITRIGDGVFQTCINLANITIPNSVTSIGVTAFYRCERLTSIYIPSNVTSIGDSAFFNCISLTSITIPGSVGMGMGIDVFESCTGLTSITIESGVTRIGNGVFKSCSSVASIVIPNTVASIGNSAFYMCRNLTSITIPNSVISIGDNAFQYCNLLNISIPDSVTSIGTNALAANAVLQDVYYSRNTDNIQDNMFYACTNLANVTFNRPFTDSVIGSGLFGSISANGTRTFIFNNTNDIDDINESLLSQINIIILYPFQIQVIPPPTTVTVITVDASFNKTYGNTPFNLDATSNSDASFNYSSQNDEIATVDENGLVTLVSPGEVIIDISQNAIEGFTSASTSTTITVNPNSPNDPVVVQDGTELSYFLTTNAEYAIIENNITVEDNLINTSDYYKNITNGTNNIISITKILLE